MVRWGIHNFKEIAMKIQLVESQPYGPGHPTPGFSAEKHSVPGCKTDSVSNPKSQGWAKTLINESGRAKLKSTGAARQGWVATRAQSKWAWTGRVQPKDNGLGWARLNNSGLCTGLTPTIQSSRWLNAMSASCCCQWLVEVQTMEGRRQSSQSRWRELAPVSLGLPCSAASPP